jgi:glycerol kinase
MTELLLAIDQGTTNTKALLVNRAGAPVFRTGVSLELATPEPGFVEQDALAIWASVERVAMAAAAHATAAGHVVRGIAISNQRETALAWHRHTGVPFAPAISWQCRRGASCSGGLAAHADAIRRTTGLPLDPVLSATKWAWLLERSPAVADAAARGDLCLGTVDSWLIWKLTSGAVHATDTTNASRTGLLDLASLEWSPEMLRLFGIPADAMPSIRASSRSFGECDAIPGLEGVPILAAIGDSHAALAGHGAAGPGAIKATYGTGSSLMTLARSLPGDLASLARTVAWSVDQATPPCTQYAVEGNIFMTGAAVQWAGEFLGLAQPAVEAAALAETVADSDGVYLVPGMVGLGAPHWDAEVRGMLCGLGRGHTRAHLARAAVESIAFQVADVFFAMREATGVPLPALLADGGATRNGSLMQFQADLLGVPVLRAGHEELSALGAAYLGGVALGWWKDLAAVAEMQRVTERFEPAMAASERDRRLEGWRDALHRARCTSERAPEVSA